MSERTSQPIPIVMRISLLTKTNQPDQSNPKYYAHKGDGFPAKPRGKRLFHTKMCGPAMVRLASSDWLK